MGCGRHRTQRGAHVAIAATVVTILGCAAAIAAFQGERHVAYPSLKVLASSGFVAVALSKGLPASGWPTALSAGLAIALLGDALLGLRRTWAFVAGMVMFLAMHLCYLTGFLARGINPVSLALATAAAMGLLGLVWRWAGPHLPKRLAPAIAVYMGALALDLAAGVSTGVTLPNAALIAGILLVGLSDLAVLRQRFVHPGLMNKVIGLPMYYAGQLLLAWAVIAAA